MPKKVGVSKRVIAYYEAEDAQPPGPMLPDLARALGVTTDELLGLESIREEITSPRAACLLERLKAAAELPAHDQRAIITFVWRRSSRSGGPAKRPEPGSRARRSARPSHPRDRALPFSSRVDPLNLKDRGLKEAS
jgi:transcriptional regulator with XRE-family HTH domain